MASFTSPELRLDHFEVYTTRSSPFDPVKVDLAGQFDKAPGTVKLHTRDLFMTPTDKNAEGIHDENAHLTWYSIETAEPEPYRTVLIENQFGEQKYRIGPPRALLVPTQKHPHGKPERLDHFKVYPIVFGNPFDPREVRLADQFHPEHHTVVVESPRYFAVPVKKDRPEIREKGGELHNPKAHLVFYWITPHPVEERRKATDQFGDFEVEIFRAFMLGVPTVKRDWGT